MQILSRTRHRTLFDKRDCIVYGVLTVAVQSRFVFQSLPSNRQGVQTMNDTAQTYSADDIAQMSKLLDTLPLLQRSCATLAEKECMHHGYAVTDVQCIVDASLPIDIGIRIEPDAVPIIRISATWAYSQLMSGDSDSLCYGIRKAVRIAYTQFRWHLGRNRPATAAEYVERARRFRLANPESFSLPVRAFRTRLVVEMVDPMTGETVSREHVRPEELSDVQREMAHELTGKVYAHAQVAELLDLLHAHKDASKDNTVVSAEVYQVGRSYTMTTLNYNTVAVDV